MSQQAMFPESQGQSSEDDAENAAYKPYYWSTTPKASKAGKTGEVLKNEHPVTFEETIPPYSYLAQEPTPPVQEPQQASTQTQTSGSGYQKQKARQQQFSPDGDAFEHGYRPYMQRSNYMAQQFPPWARPQRHQRRTWGWIILFVLFFIFMHPLLLLAVRLLAFFSIFIGVVAVAVVLIGIAVVFIVISTGFFMFRDMMKRRRSWQRGYWAGPRPWGW